MKFNFTPPHFSKWVAVSALALASFGACQKYDDSELRNKIANLEKNNSELLNQLSDIKSTESGINSDIKALNQLVSTLETSNYITNVTALPDGSGYTIAFANGEPVTVHNGVKGEDGLTPKISVGLYEGVYYWTLDGEWLTDDSGNKMPVTGEKGEQGIQGEKGEKGDTGAQGIQGEKGDKGDKGETTIISTEGVMPKVRINTDTNEWEISTDGGDTWVSTGVNATGEKGEKGDTGAQGIQGEKGDKGDKGDTGATGATGAAGKDGTDGNDGADGKDGVTPLFKIVDGNWMVSYDNGASWSDAGSATASSGIAGATVDEATKTITLTLADGTKIPITYNSGSSETSYIELDKTSESIGAEGGTITVKVNASGAYTATCPESWVTIVSGTGSYTITVAANTSTAERTATVTFNCGGTTKTLTITQSGKSGNSWDDKMETVFIKGGTFMMGEGTTQHQVTLTQDFYMGKYEVTNAQFCEFLNDKGIGSDGKYITADYGSQTLIKTYQWGVIYSDNKWAPQSGYDDYPVVNVTWYGANEYAKWIGGSLPTEAQWEYACRAGSTTAYSFGDDSDSLGDYAWYSGNGSSKTHPVGQKKSNAWGLYDMHGNVWEWCADWYDSYSTTAVTDPTGPTGGSYRVLRGGSWGSDASYCRSAFRDYADPVSYRNFNGFRVCFPSSSSIE